MARTHERLNTARRALATLKELSGLERPTKTERDAAIQRFEYTVEAVWKAAQAFLESAHGLHGASPKAAVRACREVGLLTEADARLALAMVDDRNLTSHTYAEAVAERLFARLRGYDELMDRWLAAMGDAAR